MNINIIIDNRETKLFSNIIERDLDKYSDKIVISKEQLEIGDIHIKFNDITYIYERKTISDLIASVNDGRYKEQKKRLLANSIYNNYIIENGNVTANKQLANQKLLTSIYINSIYRDNINIFFTSNIEDTITLILLIATKIIDKPDNFAIKSNIENNSNQEYIDICKIKTKKSANIDKNTCYLLQLSQIPTISKEIAKRIKDIYPSLTILIQSLNICENLEDKIKLLSKIDGVGNKKASIIIEYLL